MKKNERDALYYRYYYKFQCLLARDLNYNDMISETEPIAGNGVRKESSLPFTLNDCAHDMAGIQCGHDVNKSHFSLSKWETLRAHPWIEKIRDHDMHRLRVEECYKETYHVYLNRLKDDKRSFLDDIVEAEYYYIAVDGAGVVHGGFATTKRGYLTGLFSLSKGRGNEIFKLRLQTARKDLDASVKQFRIFCTGDFLREFYGEWGFRVTDVVEWEDKFAPKGWDYTKNGRPTLYNMEKSTQF